MTLNQFVSQYDTPGSVVLLEGKRNVLDADTSQLEALGRILTERTKHILFRSGNANGADLYFSRGVASVDAARLEVVIPFNGHRSKSNVASSTLSLDDIDLKDYPDIVALSSLNKKTANLLKRYVEGERNRITQKVAFIIRDTIKVIGVQGHHPISFAIFYDDLLAPKIGGTGHTMSVCDHQKVPYIDQTVWNKWLEE